MLRSLAPARNRREAAIHPWRTSVIGARSRPARPIVVAREPIFPSSGGSSNRDAGGPLPRAVRSCRVAAGQREDRSRHGHRRWPTRRGRRHRSHRRSTRSALANLRLVSGPASVASNAKWAKRAPHPSSSASAQGVSSKTKPASRARHRGRPRRPGRGVGAAPPRVRPKPRRGSQNGAASFRCRSRPRP